MSESLTKPALVMLVTAKPDHWVTKMAESLCDFFPMTSAPEAVSALQNVRYDLIFFDDVAFQREAVKVVSEIKRRNPTIPVIVLMDQGDEERQAVLLRAGADDFITKSMTSDEMGRHIRLMMHQQSQNRHLARRNQNLHAMASLSRLLFNAQEHDVLLQEAVSLLITTYRLYGVTFILREGDVMRLHAGSEQSAGRKLYESVMRFDVNDPYCWTVDNGITQVYHNIHENPNYTPVPVLPDAESVIILPLVYQDKILGAMGIYAMPGTVLGHEDLIVFEPFAAQFVVALQKVAQYQAQYVNVMSSQHLLRAWGRFANLNAAHEIATALRELVEEVPHAGQGVVFLYDSIDGRLENALVDSGNDEARLAFMQLARNGIIDMLINSLDSTGAPRVFDGRDLETGPFLPLFHTLLSAQVLFIPITDSTRLIGGLFIGARVGQFFTEEDANLIDNLVRTAGQMFERITLTSTIWEKSGRLEAILRTIAEGIFFVDENDNIGFLNPQFSELTGIAPSEALNQPAETLLRQIASKADDPQLVLSQFRMAQDVVSKPNMHSDVYPIVNVTLAELDRVLHIEFVKIEGLDSVRLNWACLIRDGEQNASNEAVQDLLNEVVNEHLRMPYAHVRTQIGMLTEQHAQFSHRDRDKLLHDLEGNFDHFGQLWSSFVDLYTLQSGAMMLMREPVDVAGVVQRMLNSRVFFQYSRMIKAELRTQVPQIKTDELRLERTLSNVLLVVLNLLPSGAVISLEVDRRDKEVAVVMGDLSEEVAIQIQRLMLGPRLQEGHLSPEGLAFYVSREFVQRYGGHLYVQQADEERFALVMALPIAGATIAVPVSALTTATLEVAAVNGDGGGAPAMMRSNGAPARTMLSPAQPAALGGSRAPARAMNAIMVVEGRSTLVKELRQKLEEQEYELLIYNSADEAIRDVNSTRLDLVIVDVSLRDMNGVDCCARMRARSEWPIILVTDKASETEKVRGLNVGADDYLARPISTEEMMARLNTIFKRLYLQERTREPVQIGDLYVDFARREVFLNGKAIELTRIEYDLLHILVTNRGQVLTHKQLLEKVWGPEYENETQYLWVNISRLRKKLEPTGESPRYIQNQLGIGYMFSEP
jgi:two-component system, OmpR family, KDP operon response regulator KdpE